jgi:hypothetical protein
MVWRVRCAEDENVVVASTSPLKGNAAWHPVSVEFSVPEVGCNAQWLRLELDARVVLEQGISGEVWYDRWRIERRAPG